MQDNRYHLLNKVAARSEEPTIFRSNLDNFLCHLTFPPN